MPSFMPVIADRIAEDGSIVIEACSANGCSFRLKGLETRLGILVPKGDGAVPAGGGKGAMDGVKANCVNWEQLLWVAGCGPVFAVTLEGEVETGGEREGGNIISISEPEKP